MPITTRWDNDEKTVYRLTITGIWSLDEYIGQVKRYRQDIAGVNHTVIMIVDLRGAKLLTGNAVMAAQYTFGTPTPGIHRTLIISQSSIWQHLGKGLTNLFVVLLPGFEPHFSWVRSDKEAYTMIECYRQEH